MLDLKNIEKNFQDLFERETEESFSNWLFEKIVEESISRVQNPNWISYRDFTHNETLCANSFSITLPLEKKQIAGNTQYAMAA